MRGVRGGGSVYQRRDGLWVASVTIPAPGRGRRKRRVKYGKTRDEAAAKLVDLFAEHGLTPAVRDDDPATVRARRLEAARALGTHTAREWYALVREHGGRCYYCARKGWHGDMLCKDHRIPVSRGGSDAIDNIVPACRRCNTEKGSLTEGEFLRYESRDERRDRREETEAQGRRLRLQAGIGRPLGRNP